MYAGGIQQQQPRMREKALLMVCDVLKRMVFLQYSTNLVGYCWISKIFVPKIPENANTGFRVNATPGGKCFCMLNSFVK
jgi:hypothetical protein